MTGPAPPPTRSADPPAQDRPDLLDHYRAPDGFLFTRGGGGLAAPGLAASSVVGTGPDQPQRAVRAAEHLFAQARAGEQPGLVVGAISFDGTSPALLGVPVAALRRLRSGGPAAPAAAGQEEAAPVPELAAVAEPPRGDYLRAVAAALQRISAGELRKVVLARSLSIPSPGAEAIESLLRRLRARDPHCHVFAAPTELPGGGRGLIAGASPELLVRRSGREVLSTPLAGTAGRHLDPGADRAAAELLLASLKDSVEHRLVVEAVTDTLAPLCADLRVDPHPSLRGTATVWHLATAVRGILRAPAPSALELAAALHPTPAVAGTPRQSALVAIADLETLPRGLYAGYVGWMDAAGDGEWAVCLRSLEVAGERARLFAGAGIVAGSEPAAELAETDLKFRPLLEALGG